ncbi:MAG: hypothetical protein RBR09_09335 [Desulfobulbaceae bacterium]|nr:hypothetical protein [Desulfobulbaceae bacterium]
MPDENENIVIRPDFKFLLQPARLPSKRRLSGAVEENKSAVPGGKRENIRPIVIIIPEAAKSAVLVIAKGQQIRFGEMSQCPVQCAVFVFPAAADRIARRNDEFNLAPVQLGNYLSFKNPHGVVDVAHDGKTENILTVKRRLYPLNLIGMNRAVVLLKKMKIYLIEDHQKENEHVQVEQCPPP